MQVDLELNFSAPPGVAVDPATLFVRRVRLRAEEHADRPLHKLVVTLPSAVERVQALHDEQERLEGFGSPRGEPSVVETFDPRRIVQRISSEIVADLGHSVAHFDAPGPVGWKVAPNAFAPEGGMHPGERTTAPWSTEHGGQILGSGRPWPVACHASAHGDASGARRLAR